MNNINKISDITYSDIADYIRLSEVSEDEQNYLTTLINISKDYILNYTGIDNADLDNYKDLIIVVFVLCQDMYDNRSMYVDNSNLNKVVETILGMHQLNLLPNGEIND
ncbi:MAG: phage gp6-like head-tail connector protein [Methanobrevibacter sp.]|nr:phage gp6-like head-tail connector protein [Bacilli bacterium]MBQ3415577.1 phage gp6-like head-tail connector protein [Clostridia bacterium]MBQ6630686.1 phage gp6-like head-tail connector protein [Romboutsia sp.]MBR0058170.1 phage gp6-like head-tail connector protein [Methanobrevibacter sp.]MBR0371618.1 phage gp6-like head-tail connector protein [Methanobrevibacter sp.]